MKRIKAALLDGILCWIWTIIFLEILLLIGIDLSPSAATNCSILAFFLYFLVFDYFRAGRTPGKKKMKVQVYFNDPQTNRLRFAVVHAGCCSLFYMLHVVSLLLYYIWGGRMIYEKWLDIRIE